MNLCISRPFLLVKVSGDLIGNKKVEEEVREQSEEYTVILIHGAGKQFSETLGKEDMKYHFDDSGNRVMDQEALRVCYDGPQREIKDYYCSLFGSDIGRNIFIILPISELDGELTNINADTMFRELYKAGWSKKGIVYTIDGRDKPHLRMEGVEIRYR